MWFNDACAVSDGINCYPVSTPTNNYNNWGPIRDLEVILQLPNDRAILATYQLSTEMSSPSYVITGLSVNGFYQQTTPNIQGKLENPLIVHEPESVQCLLNNVHVDF